MVLLSRMESADDYWRYCLPGMIFYISGIGTVYFVGNVTVVATASKETQGTVSGVYNVSPSSKTHKHAATACFVSSTAFLTVQRNRCS